MLGWKFKMDVGNDDRTVDKNAGSDSLGSSLNVDKSSEDGRLSCFIKGALDKTIKKSLGAVKFSLLKEHYEVICNQNFEAMKDIHYQLLIQLQSNIEQEINLMYEEENVLILLNSLDKMILQNKDREQESSWRPSGNPVYDVRDHICNVKLQHKQILQTALMKISDENKTLEHDVDIGHQDVINLKKSVEDQANDFNKIKELFQSEKYVQLENRLINNLNRQNSLHC